VSTIALHIIELVKSLPSQEQEDICAALSRRPAKRGKFRRQLQRLPDGSFDNPAGIPNEDPIFKRLQEIEEERHSMAGPPAPSFE
jgi:hypothetical protein